MVLQSQTARPQTFRKIATRSRRRRSKKGLVAVIAVMVGLIVWVAWPPNDAATTDGQPNDVPNANGLGSADPADTPAPLANVTPAPQSPVNTNDQNNQNKQNVAPTPRVRTIQAGLGSGLGSGRNAAPLPTGARNPINVPPLEKPIDTGGPTTNETDGHVPAPVFVTPNPEQRPQLALNTEIAGVKELLNTVRAYAANTVGEAGASMKKGMDLIGDGKYIEGRRVLSKLLWLRGAALDHRDADTVRRTLASVNNSLVLGDRALHDDPHAEVYVVQSGDLLSRIARRYHITYQLIEQINNVDARRIRVGQKLKVLKGPFHAVVTKSAFRMDLFLQEQDGSMTYVRSFPVGVGKDDSTPVGTWVCRANGKLSNPGWTHPRTNKHYAPDDPKNPIGEHWIALEGSDAATKGLRGYGIHGTVEPDSIGKQASLGCVRMLKDDVAMVYKMLVAGKSTVHIQQ